MLEMLVLFRSAMTRPGAMARAGAMRPSDRPVLDPVTLPAAGDGAERHSLLLRPVLTAGSARVA
jgi:hypothetical protein